MKLTVEFLSEAIDGKGQGWCITHGDKYADSLGYDEMLGLVAAITMPEKRPTLHWLKTKEQHQAWREGLSNKSITV